MDPVPPLGTGPRSRLEWISTQWPLVHDPSHVVLRYGPAIRSYVQAIIPDPHDADEATQEFLTRILGAGFPNADPQRGRFRDYLKTSVRNAALTHLRRRRSREQGGLDLDQVASPPEPGQESEEVWRTEWRRCVLDRAWSALDRHERKAPDSRYYSVLRLAADHPNADSAELAARVVTRGGAALRPEAFRKQLSRARRFFAECVVREVAETFEDPTPDQVETELIDLGLHAFVRDYLPQDWRERGRMTDEE